MTGEQSMVLRARSLLELGLFSLMMSMSKRGGPSVFCFGTTVFLTIDNDGGRDEACARRTDHGLQQ